METAGPIRVRKQRIPKACGACRRAKAKCDGKRPCTRCHGLNKICAFTDRPKEAHELKIEALEREIEVLRARLGDSGPPPSSVSSHPLSGDRETGSSTTSGPQEYPAAAPLDLSHQSVEGQPPHPALHQSSHLQPRLSGSPATSSLSPWCKKSSFESDSITLIDCVNASLITFEQAETYFAVFFEGCDHYVPVFDPCHDTFAGIRRRSSLLFNAICTVGCRMINGTDTHQWRLLDFHLKRMLNCVLATPSLACLETVQAFLVRSCYAPERSLLVAAATRMACDLGFPEAYDQLVSQSVASREKSSAVAGTPSHGENGAALMRRTRTWLHLLVLGHIYHVDAAELATYRFIGDARRSRIVLKTPSPTELDLFLFSQVELNVIRSRIYDSLSSDLARSDDGGEAISAMIKEARIDVDVWFDDWVHIFERHGAQAPWLLVNLRVQKCWAENMATCRAVRACGVEDVDFMTPVQRELLCIARNVLEEHLDIMIEEPRIYLRNLRFAMDFVWAKCTFCYLLLIKLSLLLPGVGVGRGRSSQELIDHGNILLAELRNVGGESSVGYQSSTSKLYIQLLGTGIERFSNTLTKGDGHSASVNTLPSKRASPLLHAVVVESRGQSQGGELESFVPEQYVFEWDFPGLSLFSSGIGMAWLDDILLGTMNGGDDLFGWLPPESLAE